MSNILIVSQYFWPEEFRINSIAEELTKKGHSVSVLTGFPNYPSGKIDPDFLADRKGFSALGKCKIYRVPVFPRGNGYFSLFLNYVSFFISASIIGPFKIKHLKVDCVLVYQLSPATVLIPGFLISKIKKSSFIPWVQDLWPEAVTATGVKLWKPLHAAIKCSVNFFFKRSNYVICQSKSFKRVLNQRGALKENLKFIPNWAEDIYSQTEMEYAPEITIDDKCFTIMFAGNLGEAQDLPNVLHAMKIASDYDINLRWVFVGGGRLLGWLKEEVKKNNLSKQVLILGRFQVERMPSFFLHADAMLISLKNTSVYEMTIPSKLQSYFIAGKPILGMLSGEGAELIQQSSSGFVAPAGDYEGLARIVKKIANLKEPDLIKMGENSRTFGYENYSKDKLMNELDILLRA